MEFGIQVDDLQVQAIFIDPDNYLFELRKVIIEDELQVPDNFVFLSKSGRLISRQQEKRLKVLSVSDGEKIVVTSASVDQSDQKTVLSVSILLVSLNFFL